MRAWTTLVGICGWPWMGVDLRYASMHPACQCSTKYADYAIREGVVPFHRIARCTNNALAYIALYNWLSNTFPRLWYQTYKCYPVVQCNPVMIYAVTLRPT